MALPFLVEAWFNMALPSLGFTTCGLEWDAEEDIEGDRSPPRRHPKPHLRKGGAQGGRGGGMEGGARKGLQRDRGGHERMPEEPQRGHGLV